MGENAIALTSLLERLPTILTQVNYAITYINHPLEQERQLCALHEK